MAEKMKRNVSFAKQEEQGDGIGDAGLPETKRIKTFKEKHSLDSDEEDKVDETATYRMNEEEIEGAEDDDDGTAESDDDIKITPFNLKQEMSEGYFDKDGNYHEKKDDDVHDEWLENIDWERLEEENAMKKQAEKGDEADDEDEGDAKVVRPELEVMREMLGFMKEGESVTKAMQRLGGGKRKTGSAAQRKAKKDSDSSSEVTAESKADMLKLTDLVDELVARGQFDMYQYTYEKIQHKLTQDEEAQAAKKDAEFDMFAEDVDKKKLTTNTNKQGRVKPLCALYLKNRLWHQVHFDISKYVIFRKIEERIGKFEILFDQMQIDNSVIALVSSFPFLLY
eukprot:XP_782125.3 PREDICTED: CD2 antigen cytoplasmic tail-binding protein 2 homolog [Strongylocentrotus purpuratus]